MASFASAALRRRREHLTSAWTTLREGGAPVGVRSEITASWDRSSRTVRADLDVAPMTDPEETARAWATSPLQGAVTALAPHLARTAADGDLVLAVTDASARILWTSAGRVMRRRAEAVGFAPGGRWDEASVGTNALDLALRTDAAATVWSAEHFAPVVQGWVCWAAPVHDPVTGRVLGVVDLSTTWDRAQPLGPTTAGALALLVQQAVATTAPPTAGLALRLLGAGSARLDGRRLPVTRRQLEVLALLSLHPEGLDAARLHALLYGDAPVSSSTLKAEVSHLRTALGGAVASRPYRLALPVRSDVEDVLAAVAGGDVLAAARRCDGDLLEGTESPALLQAGHYVSAAVREALLAHPDPEAALAWAEHHPWDVDVLARALARVPAQRPEHALLAARLSAACA